MPVYITRLSSFFPNRPVCNDKMEKYIGLVNQKSLLAKTLILGKNGITNRYYAIGENGEITHTNAEMAAEAVRGLGVPLEEIDLLTCGTASPEQVMPSHGVMVHGELKGSCNTEVVSFAGSCCTGMQALKYAWMALQSGDKKNAVCVASERLSAWMMARYFEKESELINRLKKRPILAFEKEFLRWMLSDGSVAAYLTTSSSVRIAQSNAIGTDNGKDCFVPRNDDASSPVIANAVKQSQSNDSVAFRIEWIELTSYANEVETCMYAGAEKDADGRLRGWTSYSEDDWLNKSIFSLKQDTKMLDEYIVPLGGRFLKEIVEKRNFDPSSVDWFLPHLSSMYFEKKIEEELVHLGYDIPKEKWFYNLPQIGNIASASAFAMLDELQRSHRLRKGDRILLMVPESARFSYAYALLTAI
ncbi:MAG: beta-ketoacyl-ACP synthase III [Tannerella sp.]|jgi:3-oxoacyl-[acyl-carrier-protein] synthase-3|nr:beta-ketoacyl-ACP synthase III [Tannerella sp.]